MTFEWDPEKAGANLRKHGVRFADAVSALEDEHASTVPEQSYDEERCITLGIDAIGRVLVVVYTWRRESIRIISARRATARECRQYEEGS